MMYKIRRSVPANTPRNNPDWQKLKISKGTIIQWIIFMPDECADLLQLQVYYHGHPVLPFNEDQWMYGFFIPTSIPDKLEIDAAPFYLDIYAVNLDDAYSHEYNLYVNIEPKKPVKPATELTSIWEKLRGWLGVE